MKNRLFTSNSKSQIFRDLLIVLAAFILLEKAVFRPVMDRLNVFLFSQSDPRMHDSFRIDSILKSQDTIKQPIYFLGSSLTRELIDVQQINADLKAHGIEKYKVYNLGASGFIVQDYYLKMDSIIRQKPFLIVLEVRPIDAVPFKFSKLSYYHYSIRRLFGYMCLYGWPEFIGRAHYHFPEIILNSVFPEIRHSKMIFYAIESRFILKNSLDSEWYAYDGRREKKTLFHRRSDFPKLTDHQARRLTIRSTRILLREFISTMKKNDIRVLLLTPPLSKKFYEKNNTYKDRHTSFMKYVDVISSRYQVDCFSPEKFPEFDQSFFYDDVHVNQEGRNAFTSYFVDILKSHLSNNGT